MQFSQLFRDKLDKIMYYDKKTNSYYHVKEADSRKMNVYTNRLFISLAAGALIPSMFNLQWWIGLIVFVISFVLIEWYYRKYLLPNMTLNKKYDVTNRIAEPHRSKGFIVFKTIVYFIVGILFFALLYLDPRDQMTNLIMIIFGFVSIGSGFKSYLEWANENKRLKDLGEK